MNIQEQLDARLKSKGLKVTKARVELLKFIETHPQVFTIVDLKKLKGLQEVNESSLYRNLAKFEEVGFIHQVPTAGNLGNMKNLKGTTITHILLAQIVRQSLV